MLEPKRIPLLTVVEKDKVKNVVEIQPTVRFNIKLDLPNESTSSEFSYIELNDGRSSEMHVDEDPFEREERQEAENLQKIADGFNNKYGGSSKKSKKRKRDISDMIDRGEGYCEDSFVDNSEPYDEVLPWCLDTKHRGFYINEGILDFIRNSDDEFEEEQPKRKKDKPLDGNYDNIKKKSKVVDQRKPKLKKKSKPEIEETDKSSNEIKSSQPASVQNPAPVHSGSAPVSKPSEKLIPVMVEKVEEPTVVEEEANELDESFVSVEETIEDPTVNQMITELTCEIIQKVALVRASQPPTAAGDNQAPLLFNANLLESLTKLHSLCQIRKTDEKHSVFERIGIACNCQKEQLYKKIKRHRINLITMEMDKKKHELDKAVSKVMPALLDKYKLDLEESNKLKKEIMMTTTTKEVQGSGDSDGDEEGRSEAEKIEKAKRIMAPRRKFMWTSEIRNLLCELVSLKLRHFDMAKIKSQTAEENLKTFLDSDIRPLWPSGWILTRALYKESKPAHINWTGDQSKTKKVPNPPSQVQPTTNQKPPAAQQQHQATQSTQQQPQNQTNVSHKPIIPPLNPIKILEDPIIINLDESDNEQSKTPLIPVSSKHHNKNVFTLIKEKPYLDASKYQETKVQRHNIPAENALPSQQAAPTQKVLESREHRNEVAGGINNVPHVALPLSSSGQIKDLETCQKNLSTGPESSSKFTNSTILQINDGRESLKKDFHGKYVTTTKSFQPPSTLNQIGNNKVKQTAKSEDCGNIFLGFQAIPVDQVDLTEDSPQHKTPKKRTLSASTITPNVGQLSDPSHANLQVVNAMSTKVSPVKQAVQRPALDVGSHNPTQKNSTGSWDVNSYHQKSSSQLYQQQLLQQQYQHQRQMMKKSPKQDKHLPTQPSKMAPNLSHGNHAVVQQSSVVGATTGPKSKQQVNEVFVQDHQDLPRARSIEVQRGFPSGASHVLDEMKVNSFQKSPMKKDVSSLTQQQAYASLQNLSPQSKPQQMKPQQVIQSSPSNQQCVKLQQTTSSSTVPSLQKPQTSSTQLLHNIQQQFNQQFFPNQNFPQDGSTP